MAGYAMLPAENGRACMVALVGIAPESLIRMLSEFRQSIYIELKAKAIRVTQLGKLRPTVW